MKHILIFILRQISDAFLLIFTGSVLAAIPLSLGGHYLVWLVLPISFTGFVSIETWIHKLKAPPTEKSLDPYDHLLNL